MSRRVVSQPATTARAGPSSTAGSSGHQRSSPKALVAWRPADRRRPAQAVPGDVAERPQEERDPEHGEADAHRAAGVLGHLGGDQRRPR